MNKIVLFFMLVLFSMNVFAQSPIDTFRQLNQYSLTQDVRVMDKLLSDDFVLTHITGYIQPKQEWACRSTERFNALFGGRRSQH